MDSRPLRSSPRIEEGESVPEIDPKKTCLTVVSLPYGNRRNGPHQPFPPASGVRTPARSRGINPNRPPMCSSVDIASPPSAEAGPSQATTGSAMAYTPRMCRTRRPFPHSSSRIMQTALTQSVRGLSA